MLVTCQWLRLVHWATLIYTEFFKKFQVFPKVKFVQSLSFSKVNFFPKLKFVQSSGFSKVQVCPKFFKFQNNGFLKMFKSISMALRPGLHLVQEGLAKEECPKEHFKKSIIQISMFSFHQSSSFSSKFTKCWFQMLISKNVKFTKYWFHGLVSQNVYVLTGFGGYFIFSLVWFPCSFHCWRINKCKTGCTH